MKGLGLAGAGLSAAAAAAPVFHDLDEVIAHPLAKVNHPWWVKERDLKDPTCELDFSTMKRYSQTLHMFDPNAFKRAVDSAEWDRMLHSNFALFGMNMVKNMNEGRPGFALRDVTLASAAGFGHDIYGMKGNFVAPRLVMRPEDYGVPRWQGTPEENTRMLRAALRVYGGRDMGVVPLDQDTRKLVYHVEEDYIPYEFEDVPKGYETHPDPNPPPFENYDPNSPETDYCNMKYKRVIPTSKQMYIVSWNSQESPEMHKQGNVHIGATSYTLAYADGRIEINRLQQFIEGIGYEALGEPHWNDLCHSSGTGVMAGIAETSRMSLTNISPRFGSGTRTWKLITDLPLAPTHPIDAGIFKFCHTCKICADACPSGAVSKESEPSWDIVAPNNSPGCKNYYYNGVKCLTWWNDGGQACFICNAVCPFLEKGKAHIHSLIKGTVAITPIFNGFFANMEKAFGFDYRHQAYDVDYEQPSVDWWELDLPEKGWDSSRSVKDY